MFPHSKTDYYPECNSKGFTFKQINFVYHRREFRIYYLILQFTFKNLVLLLKRLYILLNLKKRRRLTIKDYSYNN